RLERRLVALAERAADVLMLLDPSGIVRYQSPGIHTLLGITSESTLGLPAAALAVAEDQPQLQRIIHEASADSEGRQPHACLIRAAAADGEQRGLWVSVRNCTAEPALGGLLLAANDISPALQAGRSAPAQQTRRLELRERLLELA